MAGSNITVTGRIWIFEAMIKRIAGAGEECRSGRVG